MATRDLGAARFERNKRLKESTARFHFSKKKNLIVPCKAERGNCPYTGVDDLPHFTSIEEGYAYIDRHMGSETVKSLQKNTTGWHPPKVTVPDNVMEQMAKIRKTMTNVPEFMNEGDTREFYGTVKKEIDGFITELNEWTKSNLLNNENTIYNSERAKVFREMAYIMTKRLSKQEDFHAELVAPDFMKMGPDTTKFYLKLVRNRLDKFSAKAKQMDFNVDNEINNLDSFVSNCTDYSWEREPGDREYLTGFLDQADANINEIFLEKESIYETHLEIFSKLDRI